MALDVKKFLPKVKLPNFKKRQAANKTRKRGGKRRFGAFTAVLLVLVIALGGMAIALSLNYEPPSDQSLKKTDVEKTGDTSNTKDKDKPSNHGKVKNDHKSKPTDTEGKKDPTDKPTDKSTVTAKTMPDTKNAHSGKTHSEKTVSTAGKKKPETATKPADENNISLVKAPVWPIHERGKKGPIPRITADGRKASTVYARPFKLDGRPTIAIIMNGMGASQRDTNTVIKDLPPEFTLAFSPYAPNAQALIDLARSKGHEILIELPMEPLTYPDDDPGPMALLSGLPARVNVDRLEHILGKFAGYSGSITVMGSRFTGNEPALRPILERLHQAGVLFIDNRSSNTNVPTALSEKIGLAQATIDRVIDRRPTRVSIEKRLEDLEKIARAQGVAIGQASAYPVTLERLVVWSQRLEELGIRLAPVSALAGKQPIVARQ